jgi:TfoX/Sxy family transcriptional regulator of competence genes
MGAIRQVVAENRQPALACRVPMAYDQDFADRIREELADVDGITEKTMFGGLAFLLHGNMAVGIMSTGDLMVRVGAEGTDEALARPNTRLFEMRGRSMTGWVIVALDGVKTKRQLAPWVRRGVSFARSLPPKRR